ncbi:MAG: sulfurtransferase TusA family protein [Gammaproteobacteria bacterium]|jgi:TusA-related sulfurtransferase|nr:sulfurtransferase TusA family protein [Gammaproteobacteria bacterium]
MDINADIELDLSGLQCPMPLLKAKLALNNMQSQQILKVVATDPGSEKDFHLFVEQSNHQILGFQKNEQAYFYWIRKGSEGSREPAGS